MKKILTLLVLGLSLNAQAEISLNPISDDFKRLIGFGGNPENIPVRENPGRDAEVIEQIVHSKEVVVLKKDVSFKWTKLGYGAMTHKVIVSQLAKHTVFNHRNDGEDGPCLRSDRRRFGSLDPHPSFPDVNLPSQPEVSDTDEVVISVKILNQYLINREKRICKVNMIEDVRTVIDGEEFYHSYQKDMGFRFIGDCPAG